MRVEKVLNNNIVFSVSEHNREIILMGRGIGFGLKPGMEIDESKAEKKFYRFSDSKNEMLFLELVDRVPLEHLSVGLQIVEYVREHMNKELNENLVLGLSDHISFAIERHKQGLYLTNSLLLEIKKFYSEEYHMGMAALDIIEEQLGVRLPEDEAGFIAIHIVNAQYGCDASLSNQMLAMISDIIYIVQLSYGIVLDETSFDYIRFVTHLKFFLQRILKNDCSEQGNSLYSMVSTLYPAAAACSEKIRTYIKNKLHYTVQEEELGYLTIHIEKLTRTSGPAAKNKEKER